MRVALRLCCAICGLLRCCAICGSTDRVELHHLGGRHHAPFFKLPLCRSHHKRVTLAINNAYPNLMLPTSDREERLRRARMACLVFMWFLDEAITNETEKFNQGKSTEAQP